MRLCIKARKLCCCGLLGGLYGSGLLFHCKVESESSARAVGDGYAASMEHNSVFYYGKAESCTAFLTGASFVNAVEPFEKVGKLYFFDALTVILKSYAAHLRVVFKQCYIDIFTLGVGYGILSKVTENRANQRRVALDDNLFPKVSVEHQAFLVGHNLQLFGNFLDYVVDSNGFFVYYGTSIFYAGDK